MSRLPLPPAVSEILAAFFAAKKSGTVTLQVRDGHVLAYEVTERGAVTSEHESAARL